MVSKRLENIISVSSKFKSQLNSGITHNLQQLLDKRGFLFPSAELYPGPSSGFDLGPLAVQLKKNIENSWTRDVVGRNPEVHCFQSSILTPHEVLKASGHLEHFSDASICDSLSGGRIRVDHCSLLKTRVDLENQNRIIIPIFAPSTKQAIEWRQAFKKLVPGALSSILGNELLIYTRKINDSELEYIFQEDEKQLNKFMDIGNTHLKVSIGCRAHPITNSPFLENPKNSSLLHETKSGSSSMYLRPETAQGAYTSLPRFLKVLGLRPPFGIAQTGKAFRNEIRPEGSLFRTREFEQMEMQYFVHPRQANDAFEHWSAARLAWWKRLAVNPELFRARNHSKDELAHYARRCTDIEYKFPWGWGEVEGIADRTDFDLQNHSRASNTSMEVYSSTDGNYVPHVIETSCGLTRSVMAFLQDAYLEENECDSNNAKNISRLQFHPSLAPNTVQITCLTTSDEAQKNAALSLYGKFVNSCINIKYEKAKSSIGRRYAKADEIGVPLYLTVDSNSLNNNSFDFHPQITLRHCESRKQINVAIDSALELVQKMTSKWELETFDEYKNSIL